MWEDVSIIIKGSFGIYLYIDLTTAAASPIMPGVYSWSEIMLCFHKSSLHPHSQIAFCIHGCYVKAS